MATLQEPVLSETASSSFTDSKVIPKESVSNEKHDIDLKKLALELKELKGEIIKDTTTPQSEKTESLKKKRKKRKGKSKKQKRKEKERLKFLQDIESYLLDDDRCQTLTLLFTTWSLLRIDRLISMFQVFTNNGAYPMTSRQFICGMVDFVAPFSLLQLHVLSKWLSSSKSGDITMENLVYKIGLIEKSTECSCGYKAVIFNETEYSFREELDALLPALRDKKLSVPRFSFSEPLIGMTPTKYDAGKLNIIPNEKKDSDMSRNEIDDFDSTRQNRSHYSSCEDTEHIEENRYVELQLYFVIYDIIVTSDLHFTMLLSTNTRVLTILNLIRQHTDIQADEFSIFLPINKYRRNRHPLPKMSTLKQCGYHGYCKKHPQKVLLFYDCQIEFKSHFISALDKYYNTNNESKVIVYSNEN